MNRRDDPERWRWEQHRERETREVEQGARFERDTGDPRWGTGGLRVDERSHRPQQEVSERREASSPHGLSTRGPYVGRGPRGYRRSDERIRDNVCEWFTLEGDLDASDIEVEVRNGVVTLGGTVATRAQKRLAEDIAEAVLGVVEVCNYLHVERPGGVERRAMPGEAGPQSVRDGSAHESAAGGGR
ncbi:MAG TPA: BON domain-containing protein [Polyangiaceae bacterium]|nr:BON domain-containing protein [Polyangiaceae bacterium]